MTICLDHLKHGLSQTRILTQLYQKRLDKFMSRRKLFEHFLDIVDTNR